MKKAFKIIYSILFFILCALPLALMPFLKTDAEIEKRELAKFPKYVKGKHLNVDFSTQFESWVNDHLPLRANLLSVSNYLRTETLKVPSSNVICGKDGWLFYSQEGDDYMHTNPMSDERVNATGITLSLIQEVVQEKGGNFTFVPMPNKASVYGDYLPACYIKSKETNLSKISDAAEKLGVNYVDMQKILSDHKDEGIYHKRDSHWNYLGAMIGYNAIMDNIGKEHETYEDAEYKKKKDWRADLDKLLYPAGGTMDYQYYYDIAYKNFMFTRPMGVADNKSQLELFMSDKEQGDETIMTSNMGVKDDKILYMVRDSFGRALLPMMIDNYKTATFKRTVSPDIVSVEENTDVIYEIVERNLTNVTKTAPYMFAPSRDTIDYSSYEDGGDVTYKYEDMGYAFRAYGKLPDDTDLGDGRVYVEYTKGSDTYTYEAFPIYETELLDGENSTNYGNGFSLYIDPEVGDLSEFEIKVIAGNTVFTVK